MAADRQQGIRVKDSTDNAELLDHRGEPLNEAKKNRFRRIRWTHVAAWCAFIHVFLVRGDELVSTVDRWINGTGELTVVAFDHERRGDHASLFSPGDSARLPSEQADTSSVELEFKLINHSSQTVLLERVELGFEAEGEVPEGMAKTAKLEVSGEYTVAVPNLQPSESAERYVSVPHVLKPGDADRFTVTLAWPPHVDITGIYTVSTSLITTAGKYEMDAVSVPVLSDRRPVAR